MRSPRQAPGHGSRGSRYHRPPGPGSQPSITGATARYRCSVSPGGWRWVSAGGGGEEGGDDVRGVTVKGLTGPVVAHGRARVGVRGGLLDVP